MLAGDTEGAWAVLGDLGAAPFLLALTSWCNTMRGAGDFPDLASYDAYLGEVQAAMLAAEAAGG